MKKVEALTIAALLAGLPAALHAQDNAAYGYQKSSETTTNPDGSASQTTTEKTWVSQTDGSAPADTAADKAANAKMGVTDTTAATESDGAAAGQHTQAWYSQNLQSGSRYALNPETNKLEPVKDNPTIKKLNHAAKAKDTVSDTTPDSSDNQ